MLRSLALAFAATAAAATETVGETSRRDLNVLRGVVDGMVRADPRLRREAENVRAPIRVATRIQRAWRARRRRKGDASASSP